MCIAKQSKQLMKRCVGDADLGVVMRAWFLRIFHNATSGRRGFRVLCSHLFHEKSRPPHRRGAGFFHDAIIPRKVRQAFSSISEAFASGGTGSSWRAPMSLGTVTRPSRRSWSVTLCRYLSTTSERPFQRKVAAQPARRLQSSSGSKHFMGASSDSTTARISATVSVAGFRNSL